MHDDKSLHDEAFNNGQSSEKEKKAEAEKLKKLVIKEIEANRKILTELSLKIHSNPEKGRQEVKAAKWLSEYLEQNGFLVERGICDLPTAFRASYGRGKPMIALIAEYDALPNLGHACGHNLIAVCSVSAAIASKLAIDRFGGSILVIGTPDEEFYGGKITMAAKGAFNDLDAAMMVHPGWEDRAVHYTFAAQALNVEFFGKSAHASAEPELGVNALEALLQSFSAINSLRQHIKEKARIHGIITDGGQAPNIVPDHSAASFIVRAASDAYLAELTQRVLNCFIGAATATGARLEYKWTNAPRATMRTNLTLAELFSQNMQILGRTVKTPDPNDLGGSADMGNVSQVAPSIHAWVAITPTGLRPHTPEFAQAAASEGGIQGLFDGAKSLAMTVVDIVANPELCAKIKQEFKERN